MRELLVFWGIALVANSCIQSTGPSMSDCNIIEPKNRIKPLLDSFVLVNGDTNAIYEIYIDKTSPHSYSLILYTGNESLTREEDSIHNQYPVMKLRSSNVVFTIYSGIEHYFQNAEKRQNEEKRSYKRTFTEHETMWAVKDSADIYTIYKTYGAYPYLPLPNLIPDSIRFNPPR